MGGRKVLYKYFEYVYPVRAGLNESIKSNTRT